MNRVTTTLTVAAFCLIGSVEARAYPMVATFQGFVNDSGGEAFQASFYYNPKDLGAPDQAGYRNAVGGIQRATYTDASGVSFSYANPISFYLGNYVADGFDPDGTPETNNVVEYSLNTGNGLINFTFGGFNDGGVATFSADGLDSKTLTPTRFILTKDIVDTTPPGVSPVPLPAPVALFGGALVVLGCCGRLRRVSAPKAA